MVVKRTTPADGDFKHLVDRLDEELWSRYPDLQHDYAGNNLIPGDALAVVCYREGAPVGCGCLRLQPETGTAEVKRMFVEPAARRRGVAGRILVALETIAREHDVAEMFLETGVRQPEAIALYAKHGFEKIENFGPYAGNSNSVCMKKTIR